MDKAFGNRTTLFIEVKKHCTILDDQTLRCMRNHTWCILLQISAYWNRSDVFECSSPSWHAGTAGLRKWGNSCSMHSRVASFICVTVPSCNTSTLMQTCSFVASDSFHYPMPFIYIASPLLYEPYMYMKMLRPGCSAHTQNIVKQILFQ